MELCKEDFDTVLIAEGGWGPIDKQVAESNENLFYCQRCSGKRSVFHNVQGKHLHIDEVELGQKVDAQFWF